MQTKWKKIRGRLLSALLSLAVVAGACPLTAAPAWADNSNGTLSGTVTQADVDAVFGSSNATLSGTTVTLQKDTKVSSTITVSTSLTLDLNGHVLDRGKNFIVGVDGSAIKVSNSAALTLCDSAAQTVHEGDYSTLPKGGVLTGGYTTGSGGGVYVSDGAQLTMNGGSISGNIASSEGGGVYVVGSAHFTMTGGSISGNCGVYGGGGVSVVGSSGQFTMTGGSISGNDVYAQANAYGGGVCIAGGAFQLDGSSYIVDNVKGGEKDTATGSYTGGETNNVYLAADKTIALQSGNFAGVVGVTLRSYPADVTGAANVPANFSQHFFLDTVCSDSSYYQLSLSNSVLKAEKVADEKVKKVTADGTANGATDGKFNTLANAVTALNSDAAGGWMIDVQTPQKVDSAAAIPAVTKDVTLLSSNGSTVKRGTLSSDSLLIVGNFSGASPSVTLQNITLDGGYNNDYQIGNKVGSALITVYSGALTLNPGAAVQNNYCSNNLGGIAAFGSGSFTMNGGSISGNSGAHVGGVHSGGTFTMNGGRITGNHSTFYGLGSGVRASGSFKVSGSARITGNTTGAYAEYPSDTPMGAMPNNVYLESSATIAVVGVLASNAAFGVTLASPPTASSPTPKTVATNTANADYSSFFISDNADYVIQNDSNTVKLALAKHRATVSNVTVSGTAGTALAANRTATLTLHSDQFNTADGVDASSWFTGLPEGTAVTFTATDKAATGKLTFSGTPTASSSAAMQITIPASALVTNEALTVEANADAKFNIQAASTDAALKTLTLSSGTLSPAFASATDTYTASVANSVDKIKVTPKVNQANATVTVNNVSVTSGSASGDISLSVGTNTITVKVTAQDTTTTKTYTVTVTRAAAALSTDATLSAVTLSSGTLSPAFASATDTYTASVANSVDKIKVTPKVNQANAAVTVNNVSVTSGNASGNISLNVGTNTITVKVTAQDTTITKTYTVTVTRAAAALSTDATLSALTLSSGTLSPTFASATDTYTARVANSVQNITVAPTVNQANAAVTVNNVPVTSGSASGNISLSVGTNTITVKVTAQDTTTTKTYTVTVTRAAAQSGGSGSTYTPSADTIVTAPAGNVAQVKATLANAVADPSTSVVLEPIDEQSTQTATQTVNTADTKKLAGESVYLYETQNGKLTLVDNKPVPVDVSGNVTLTVAKNAQYVMVPASEKPPVSDVVGTVKVAQGNTVPFHVTSGKATDAGFAAGNDKTSETRVFEQYANNAAYYGAYGHGKLGDKTGVYVNGVKLFEVEIVKAPYKSDTTVNVTTKTTGQTYWFKITPDSADAKVAYTAGNGTVLSTMSKGRQADGSYLFGFKITGKPGEKSGVYVQLDSQNYCAFNVGVV